MSAWCSTLEGHSQNLSAMSSSQMMRFASTRKPRRRRLWQLHPEVLPESTERCTITALPTHLASRSSISSSHGFCTHLSASTSRQHPRLYHHLRLCCFCLRHRLLELPPVTPASTVVARATSLESAPRQRRTPLRATSPIRHVVHRRWSMQRPGASTTPLWTFQRVSKSSRVCFL
jgi:hypothetical protein